MDHMKRDFFPTAAHCEAYVRCSKETTIASSPHTDTYVDWSNFTQIQITWTSPKNTLATIPQSTRHNDRVHFPAIVIRDIQNHRPSTFFQRRRFGRAKTKLDHYRKSGPPVLHPRTARSDYQNDDDDAAAATSTTAAN